MPYATFDVETNTKSPVGFAGSPFWPDNGIVMLGVESTSPAVVPGIHLAKPHISQWDGHDMLVGHNIKFDIHHWCKAVGTTPRALLKNKTVWDTSAAHYILTGMRDRSPSLNEAAARYSLGTKGDAVGALIKSGVDPEDIDPDMLEEYLRQDVKLTADLFKKQYLEAQDRGMLTLMWAIMRAVCATCDMEWNGLHVSVFTMSSFIRKWELEIAEHQARVEAALKLFLPDETEVNIGSGKQISTLLFGGTSKVRKTIDDGFYKNGKPKTKKVTIDAWVPGMGFDPKKVKANPNNNGYEVDDSVLENILEMPGFSGSVSGSIVQSLRKYRELSKLISTYGEGLKKHVFPDLKIHPSLNHNITATGRLSCSSPNLQNQADHEFRKTYISRFKTGSLVEIDYAQLEIIGLAILSGDTQLTLDLRAGKDIHSELYNAMYGCYPTKEQRKPFKSLTFGLVYGAGVNTLAENGKVSKADAKLFIKTFYDRYPGVQKFHDDMIALGKSNREISPYRCPEDGRPLEQFKFKSITGREYCFVEKRGFKNYKTGEWEYGMSPTELKNYPVQGFATADIVPLMLGKIANWLWNSPARDSLLMVLTVHDSLMFDSDNSPAAIAAIGTVTEMLLNTAAEIKSTFGVNVNVPFNVEVKMGPSWYSKDMEVVHA